MCARAALLARDRVERALVCMSSPLGIECLPREQSLALIDAYHDGALALGAPFGVWGAATLDGPDGPDGPDGTDVDRALARGCVGLSLPAGALAGVESLRRVRPLLDRLEAAGAPLLVHPGPGPRPGVAESRRPLVVEREPTLADPLWWSALTRYVSQMHAAWLTFVAAGRAEHPRLRVVFAMLAGLAPLHAERLSARGGPSPLRHDALTFYETSSYGRDSIRRIAEIVGAAQILYGSDRPVVDPAEHGALDGLDWQAIADATRRALGERGELPRGAARRRDDAHESAPPREQALSR